MADNSALFKALKGGGMQGAPAPSQSDMAYPGDAGQVPAAPLAPEAGSPPASGSLPTPAPADSSWWNYIRSMVGSPKVEAAPPQLDEMARAQAAMDAQAEAGNAKKAQVANAFGGLRK